MKIKGKILRRDYRQYSEHNSFYEKKGWLVEQVNGSFVLIRQIPILGSVIKIKRCDPEISLQKIEALAKKYRALFIKLELNLTTNDPRTPAIIKRLKDFGYEESQWAFCPTRTIHINLALSLAELLAQTKKDARRYLRKNQEKNFQFCQDKNLEDFYPLLQRAGKIKGYFVPKIEDLRMQWESFGESLRLLLGYKDGKLLGGSLTICRGGAAFGIHMALSKDGVTEKFSYSLMWESMKLSKGAGSEILDLDGIYDPRFRTHAAWRGLTEFKEKFGGQEVEFLGPFTKCRFLPFRIFCKFGLI